MAPLSGRIYSPQISDAGPINWDVAFYEFAKLHPIYQFVSDIRMLTADVKNIILLNARCQYLELSDEVLSNTTVVVLPENSPDAVKQHGELLAKAKKVIILGKNNGENSSFVTLSNVLYLSVLPFGDWSAPSVIDDVIRDEYVRCSDLHLLSPKSYLLVWEYFIAKRFLPSQLTIYIEAGRAIPDWFVGGMQSHNVDIFVRELSRKNMSAFRSENAKFLRDEGAMDPIDVFAHELGMAVIEVRSDGSSKMATRPDCSAVMPIMQLLDMVHDVSDKTTNNLGKNMACRANSGDENQVNKLDGNYDVINVVCYKPTYLFRDLVQRFVNGGCVHSEIALSDAKKYIWIRPQEYIATTNLVSGLPVKDVPNSFQRAASGLLKNRSGEWILRLATRSVVIHHGICPKPIYQFDPIANATRLREVRAVAGVCPFELCYRGVESVASRDNFKFIPIGFDDSLFVEGLVRQDIKSRGTELQIGFVGRAYGTKDANLLASSETATPVGYIKGGDLLINICIRLAVKGIGFHLHIVGNGWQDLVRLARGYGITCSYYERDKSIEYKDYAQLFASFDLLLIPSRGESGPVPAVEAMSVGVPVVGCESAGMVKYLGSLGKGCLTFSYDSKWHTMDYEKAVKHIESIFQREVTNSDRIEIRRSVEAMTTQAWISSILELCNA